jgi:hypothetical protein
MADVKISGLPASTTPLVGTEVLPVVQSGATKQVSVANLTAGRATSALSYAATKDITSSANQGSYSYGTLGYSDINIYSSYTSSANAYTQKIVQNTNAGAAASVDFIVSNDVGTASTYYGDFGVTSSGYNTPGQNIINTASTVYLQSVTMPLAIGTLNSNALSFYTNSTLVGAFSAAGVFSITNDVLINGLTVGKGGGNQSAATVLGNGALSANTTVNNLTAIGYQALNKNTTNVATFGTITGGSGYTNGTYTAVAMTPVSGATFATYPTVTVIVSGGAVTSVTLVTAGVGASSTAATVLTVASALIGGTGSGFSIPVNTFASGAQNTATGYQSGFNTSTGSQNVFNGFQAGYSNTTALETTAIGFQALYSNVSGNSNTAIGKYSLYFVTSSNNSAIGANSLYNTTSGSLNVGLGKSTLYANNSGSGNTAVGYQAGYGNGSANANTTGSYNTYLGYLTVGSGVNNINELVIGSNGVGLGSNTTVIGNTSTTLTQTYGVTKSTNYTVATLPSASTSGVGAKAFVTDALAPTFGATVATGGAIPVPVYSDGTNWKVG